MGTQILTMILLNAALICGVWIAANYKDDAGRPYILRPLKEWLDRRLGTYWSKPFLGCYRCMPSLWAAFPMASYLLHEWQSEMAVVCVGAGLMYGAAVVFAASLLMAAHDALVELAKVLKDK